MKQQVKRLLALMLALSMCLSLLSVNVWAADLSEDATGQTTEVPGTTEEPSEPDTDPAPAESPSELPTAPDPTEPAPTEPATDPTDAPPTEAAPTEALTAPAAEAPALYPAFAQRLTVDGVTVTVSADEGVFPAGATLSVEQVQRPEQRAADAAVDAVRDGNRSVAVSYTFDIKVLDASGVEVQPAPGQRVNVSFATAEVADENLETSVYHVTEDEDTGKLSASPLDVRRDTGEDAAASVETDGFSLYTVEFTYNALEYVLPGGTSVPLSDILTALSLTGEVTEVTVSNAELFSAERDNGAWVVTAHQAFSTAEWMKLTINGVAYEITVTDDTESDAVLVSDWEALQAALNNGGTVRLSQNITAVLGNPSLQVPAGVTVALDLNGFTIDGCTMDKEPFFVYGDLTVSDSGESGTILSSNYSAILVPKQEASSGGSLILNGGSIRTANLSAVALNAGSLTMNGGSLHGLNGAYGLTLYGGSAVVNGGTISCDNGGYAINLSSRSSLSVKGGTISGGSHGHAIVADFDFTLSGAPEIIGDVWLEGGAVIALGDALTCTTPIAVKPDTPRPFTRGWADKMGENDPAAYFTSVVAFGQIALTDGEACLRRQSGTLSVTTWDELSDALFFGGDVRLDANVTAPPTDELLTIASGTTVVLDLNGHTIDTSAVTSFFCTLIVGGTLSLTGSGGILSGTTPLGGCTSVLVAGGSLILSGEPSIPGGVGLYDSVITIGDALSPSAPIPATQIRVDNTNGALIPGPGVITHGWSDKLGDADPADYFASVDPLLTLSLTDGEVDIKQSGDTITVTTWAELRNALNRGGSIRLGANITAAENDLNLSVPSDNTAVLDLNEHTIDGSALPTPFYILMVGGELTLTGTGGILDSTAPESGRYGIAVDGSLILSGDPSIPGGVGLVDSVITIGDALNPSAPIPVAVVDSSAIHLPTTAGTITSGWSDKMNDADPANYFTSVDSAYLMRLNGSGEVELYEPVFYDLSIESATGGSVSASVTRAAVDDPVTLTVEPESGYALFSLSVKQGDDDVALTPGANDTFTFQMPAGNVSVTAVFARSTANISLTTAAEDLLIDWAYGDDVTIGWDGNGSYPAGAYVFTFSDEVVITGVTADMTHNGNGYVYSFTADAGAGIGIDVSETLEFSAIINLSAGAIAHLKDWLFEGESKESWDGNGEHPTGDYTFTFDTPAVVTGAEEPNESQSDDEYSYSFTAYTNNEISISLPTEPDPTADISLSDAAQALLVGWGNDEEETDSWDGDGPHSTGTYSFTFTSPVEIEGATPTMTQTDNGYVYTFTASEGDVITIDVRSKTPNPMTVTETACVIRGGNTVDLSENVSCAVGDISYAISGADNGCTLSGSVLTSGDGTGSVSVTVTAAGNDTYSSATGTITVTVTDKAVEALTVTQSGITYGETLPAPSYQRPAADGTQTLSYSGGDYGPTATAPTGAGSYTVTVTYETEETLYTGTADFTIAAKPITITAKAQSIRAGQSIATGTDQVELSSSALVTGHTLIDIALSVNAANDTITPSAAVIWGGETVVTANYDITYAPGTLTVLLPQASVTAAPAANNRTYNSHAEDLLTGGAADTSLEYSRDGESWTTAVPQETNAGTYQVWYRAAADENHLTGDAVEVAVTIDRAAITPQVSITDWRFGDTPSQPEVTGNPGDGGVSFTYYVKGENDQYTPLDGVPTAVGAYKIVATVGESDNYLGNTCEQTFQISRRAQSISVSMQGWTYGETANEPDVRCTGDAEVSIRYKAQDADDSAYTETKPTNAGSYTVKAELAQTDTEESASDTADFTIARADRSAAVTLNGWTYGDSAGTPGVSANPENGAVSYQYMVDGEWVDTAPVPAGTYQVRAVIGETTNYNRLVTEAASFTIQRRTATVTPTVTGKVFGDDEPQLTYDVSNLVSGDTLTVTLSRVGGEAVGEYDFSLSDCSNPNYEAVLAQGVKFTITRTVPSPDDLTDEQRPTAKTGLSYNAQPQELVTPPSELPAGIAKLQYCLDDSDNWQNAIPTGTEARTYSVAYRYVGEGGETIPGGTLSVTIEQKTVGLTWSNLSFTYDKKSHIPTAKATGLVGGDTCTVTVTGAQTNAGTYTATATELSNSNYALPAANTAQFTIRKANPTVSAPASVVKGKSVTITVTGGTASFASSNTKLATVTNTGLVKGVALGKLSITVTVAGSANYNQLTQKLPICVCSAPPALSSVTNSKSKAMTVNWRPVAEVTGYQIEYSTDKSFAGSKFSTVKGTNAATWIINSLTLNSTYYVRVRTYYGDTTNVSAWSKTLNVKISK